MNFSTFSIIWLNVPFSPVVLLFEIHQQFQMKLSSERFTWWLAPQKSALFIFPWRASPSAKSHKQFWSKAKRHDKMVPKTGFQSIWWLYEPPINVLESSVESIITTLQGLNPVIPHSNTHKSPLSLAPPRIPSTCHRLHHSGAYITQQLVPAICGVVAKVTNGHNHCAAKVTSGDNCPLHSNITVCIT